MAFISVWFRFSVRKNTGTESINFLSKLEKKSDRSSFHRPVTKLDGGIIFHTTNNDPFLHVLRANYTTETSFIAKKIFFFEVRYSITDFLIKSKVQTLTI